MWAVEEVRRLIVVAMQVAAGTEGDMEAPSVQVEPQALSAAVAAVIAMAVLAAPQQVAAMATVAVGAAALVEVAVGFKDSDHSLRAHQMAILLTAEL